MGGSHDVKANARRVAHPAVRAKMLEVLGDRLPRADRDDIIQAAYVRLLMIAELPEDDDGLLGLAVVVVRGRRTDHFRAAGVREARHEDGADVDEVLPDQAFGAGLSAERVRAMLEFVDREVAKGRVPPEVARWSRMLLEGRTYEEIAAAEGIPVGTVKTRMARAREHLAKHWPKYAAGITATVVLVLVWRHRPQPDIWPDDEYATPSAPAPTARPATSAERQEQAADLLDRAQKECQDQDYVLCETDLDAARELDPNVEDTFRGKELRKTVEWWKAHPPSQEPWKLKKQPDKPAPAPVPARPPAPKP